MMRRKNVVSPAATVLFTEWNAANIPGATKDLSYNVDGDLSKIELYEEAGKVNLLFTKDLSYTDGVLTEIAITRESDGATATKTLSYDIDGNLDEVVLS